MKRIMSLLLVLVVVFPFVSGCRTWQVDARDRTWHKYVRDVSDQFDVRVRIDDAASELADRKVRFRGRVGSWEEAIMTRLPEPYEVVLEEDARNRRVYMIRLRAAEEEVGGESAEEHDTATNGASAENGHSDQGADAIETANANPPEDDESDDGEAEDGGEEEDDEGEEAEDGEEADGDEAEEAEETAYLCTRVRNPDGSPMEFEPGDIQQVNFVGNIWLFGVGGLTQLRGYNVEPNGRGRAGYNLMLEVTPFSEGMRFCLTPDGWLLMADSEENRAILGEGEVRAYIGAMHPTKPLMRPYG